jgi:hypothetical protein
MHESSGPNEEAKGISHQVLIIRSSAKVMDGGEGGGGRGV